MKLQIVRVSNMLYKEFVLILFSLLISTYLLIIVVKIKYLIFQTLLQSLADSFSIYWSPSHKLVDFCLSALHYAFNRLHGDLGKCSCQLSDLHEIIILINLFLFAPYAYDSFLHLFKL